VRSELREVTDFPRLVPLAAILERYGYLSDLKKIGSQLFGVCPIHQGSNKKQFVVDLNKGGGVWRCFGNCNAGGGSLEFVARKENVGIKEAARLVRDWFALAPLRQRQHRKPKEYAMSGKQPTHKVFAVRDGNPDDPNSKPWYTRIGSAWPIKSGKGLSIQLDALPVNDRIVLFEFEDADEAAEDEKKQAARKPMRK
jgi:hypothetical protein